MVKTVTKSKAILDIFARRRLSKQRNQCQNPKIPFKNKKKCLIQVRIKLMRIRNPAVYAQHLVFYRFSHFCIDAILAFT
jgi:hypothetical protein